jgi:hypothetical protein
MAARHDDDGTPLDELTAEERCRLAVFLFRAVHREAGLPPDAPTQARLQAVE